MIEILLSGCGVGAEVRGVDLGKGLDDATFVEIRDAWHEHGIATRCRQLGELVIWDNRCLMHRRDPFDGKQRRLLHRTQVVGEIPA